MQDEGCRRRPGLYIRRPTSCIQAASFSSLLADLGVVCVHERPEFLFHIGSECRLYNPVARAHHRGQLAAYLRAMGSAVPAIYGGSADEPFQAAASA